MIRKIILKWASQYSLVHYGVASLEEVEMMEVAPEPLHRQPSRSSIRTNPHTKWHAAIKNDRIREQLTHQQGRVAGAQRQLSFQEAKEQLQDPALGFTVTLRPAGAPVESFTTRNRISKDIEMASISVI